MELRHLKSFVAIAEEGSVTRAAGRLYIAQPALSRQLRELERHIDATLFVRRRHGVELTEAGVRLLAEARPLLAAAERLARPTAVGARERQGHLAVGLLDEGAAELNEPHIPELLGSAS